MNKSQLIEKLASNISTEYGDEQDPRLHLKLAKQTVDLFFCSIKDALAEGDRVEIRGLGSFTMKEYEGYSGRNPKTGEQVEVLSKKLPVFKPGKELKKIVNDLEIME